MLLPQQDAEHFFKLHQLLMFFVNERKQVIAGWDTGKQELGISLEDVVEIRDTLVDDIDLIDEFVAMNPFELSHDELEIVAAWRGLVAGEFFVFRQLKKHAILIGDGEAPSVYGVLGLTEPLVDVVGSQLPVLVKAVLLPFKGKIIYDALLSSFPVSFSSSIKRELNDIYRQAKADKALVTSLPTSPDSEGDVTITKKKAKATRAKKSSGDIYQFKVTLQHSEPTIWRRIQVPDCTLDDFHFLLQAAMGWTNSHLHDFQIGGERYGDPTMLGFGMDDYDGNDSSQARLSDILPADKKKFRFGYMYDFGDSWEHLIEFERQLEPKSKTQYPLCTAGTGACPPEDIGGVWGFMELVEALADPQHERHDEFTEWVGEFDAEDFTPDEATHRLQALKAW